MSLFLYWITMTRKSLERGCPFGNEGWVEKTVKRLGSESTQRSRTLSQPPLQIYLNCQFGS